MATITKLRVKPSNIGSQVSASQKVIDFAVNSTSAADVVHLFAIPADTFVKGIKWYIITGEGATCTGTIGDSAAVDVYDASINMETAAASGYSDEDVDTVAQGKFYSAANNITLTTTHATDAAKVLFIIEYISLDADLA